mgnify:CR=1 FL=1
MGSIKVIGLGPGDFGYITMECWELMQQTEHLYLRTAKHPTVPMLEQRGVAFATYDDFYEINFNKELSFPTSCNKSIRLGLKIINAFAELNNNILSEFGFPLNMVLTVSKKMSENLQSKIIYGDNLKLLTVSKTKNKYLKGFQLIMDEYVWDEINKDYKTDSLYSIEQEGKTLMFYEIILNSYVLPPDKEIDDAKIEIPKQKILNQPTTEIDEKDFEIHACISILNIYGHYKHFFKTNDARHVIILGYVKDNYTYNQYSKVLDGLGEFCNFFPNVYTIPKILLDNRLYVHIVAALMQYMYKMTPKPNHSSIYVISNQDIF